MITVSPRVQESVFHIKHNAVSVVHVSGDFLTENLRNITYGNISKFHTEFVNHLDGTLYNGWIEITLSGIRRLDNSAIHLGKATFYIQPSDTNLSALTPLISDVEWDSQINGGALGGAGLHSYFRGLPQHNLPFLFYKREFAYNERDTTYTKRFINSYALDYKLTIKFLHRKYNKIDG